VHDRTAPSDLLTQHAAPLREGPFRAWVQQMRQTTTFKKQRALARGFTLIEVMITVAIVAILAAIALPAYGDYLRRGQLPEAFTTMSNLRVRFEQYYQDNRAYGVGTNCLGLDWSSNAIRTGRNFTFSCALTGGTQGFTITATGNAGTRADGHVYTVAHDNAQTTTTFKGVAVSGRNCWLVRGSEC
jgi:type IV pilus assembly protein PilE